jgi:hypothetical protein
MPLTRINFFELSEEDLLDEIAASVPEGMHVDYKRDTYGRADNDVREFLKDVSSFANTTGGHLVIGMEAVKGIPTALKGLSINTDDELLRFENLLNSAIEPRVFGIQMLPIPVSSGGVAIVIRIPQSWRPPHRVIYRGSNKFYGRNSAGVFELSVEDLRMLFTSGAEAAKQMRAFRDERVEKLAAGRGIAAMMNHGGLLILHLVPLSAFRLQNQLDLNIANAVSDNLAPLGDLMGYTPAINFDGFSVRKDSDRGCLSYTHVFRNGALEAVKVRAKFEDQAKMWISPLDTEKFLIQRIPNYLDALRGLGITPPIGLMITLHDVEDARLLTGSTHGDDPKMGRHVLALPEIMIENFGTKVEIHRALRPAFDSLWNTAGKPRSPYFNDQGEWVGRKI